MHVALQIHVQSLTVYHLSCKIYVELIFCVRLKIKPILNQR